MKTRPSIMDGTDGYSLDFLEDLARAVESDHPCGDAACDIAASLEAGAPLFSAWMLESATGLENMEEVSRVLEEHEESLPLDIFPTDSFHAWKAYHDRYGVQCRACEAYNYGNDYWMPERCGNCLEDLKVARVARALRTHLVESHGGVPTRALRASTLPDLLELHHAEHDG